MAKTTKPDRRYREDLSEMPDWLRKKRCPNRDKYLSGKRIQPKNLTGKEKLESIVDDVFLAYNSARLKEGCQLFTGKMLAPEVTIGMSFAGALTPAGLGCSCIVPLIKAGFVDWIVEGFAASRDRIEEVIGHGNLKWVLLALAVLFLLWFSRRRR